MITSLRPDQAKVGRPHLKNKIKLDALLHTCNPSYSGWGDWEDHTVRPAHAKSLPDPLSTIKARCGGGMHLSSQLCGKKLTGGSRSRLTWA
jgi:hypothetical protein